MTHVVDAARVSRYDVSPLSLEAAGGHLDTLFPPRCRAIGRHASVNFPLEHDATGEVHAAKALLGLLA